MLTTARMAAVAAVSALSFGILAEVTSGSSPSKAPEFPTLDPSRWVGTPVRLADLRGKVVLLDVWTFG